MIDPRLAEATRSEYARTGVDWRNAYLGESGGRMRAYPAPMADACGVERLESIGPAILTTPLEPLRALPAHRSELVSELRGGEFLELLLREGSWCLVQGEDGYVGWVADWNLREQSVAERAELLARYRGRYALPLGTLWNSDHWAASPLWRGTPLLRPDDDGLSERSGEERVQTPWGAEGWLSRLDIETPPERFDLSESIRSATQMLGTPYRWGGRSAGGWDCSGFTQHCFAMAGLRLPRDAAQQIRCGDRIESDPTRWRAGDLLFFGEPVDHVGLFDGRGALLHASGLVRRQPLGEIEPLMGRLSGVRRLVGPDAGDPGPASLWR